MIEPKEIEIDGRKFIISKFPALAGYEIATQLAISSIPKMAEFKNHRDMFVKMLGYVGVPIAALPQPLMLSTESLIDNHTGNWETMAKLGYAVYEYNVSFLAEGGLSNFLDSVMEKLPEFITQILTKWQGQSSTAEKPAITN